MVVIALAAALGACTVVQAEWKLSGYAQARYNFWDNDLADQDDSFDIRRARLTADGPVGPEASFRAQIELGKLDDAGANDVELKELWIKRPLNPQWTAQLGFVCTPFGIEVPQSNATLLTLERSQAAEKLFPGQRDTGLYLTYKPTRPDVPTVTAGFSNGLDKWYDADKSGNEDTGSEMLLARAQWDLSGRGTAGLSFRHASRTRTLGGTDRDFSDDLWGLHARYNVLPAGAVQAEYYDGEELGVDVSGWYGQAEYTFTGRPLTAYYRYDAYDFGGADDYARNTLGLAWNLSKNERVTLQGEDYDDGKGGEYTNIAVQYQFVY